MRTTTIALSLLLATLAASHAGLAQTADCPCPCPPAADADNSGGDPGVASIGYFHEQLSPYGEWVRRPGYGEVWVPAVGRGWRPYTTGHWVYTDQGWAWVADESWGWAPFHYGRWFYEAGLGWGWVPGTVWAPAWVAWRHGGGYVGWAALPPAVGFAAGVGVSWGGVDLNVAIAPSYYAFVSERAILTPRLATVIVAPTRNVTIIHNTTNITNYTVVNNRVVNNGVDVKRIEQMTGSPVPRTQVAGHAGFYQPAVMARAARATPTETFVNRPAGGAGQALAKAAAGGRAATGATGQIPTALNRSAAGRAAASTQGVTPRATTRSTAAGVPGAATSTAGHRTTAYAGRNPGGSPQTATGTGAHGTTGSASGAHTRSATHHRTGSGTTGSGASAGGGTSGRSSSTGSTGAQPRSTGYKPSTSTSSASQGRSAAPTHTYHQGPPSGGSQPHGQGGSPTSQARPPAGKPSSKPPHTGGGG